VFNTAIFLVGGLKVPITSLKTQGICFTFSENYAHYFLIYFASLNNNGTANSSLFQYFVIPRFSAWLMRHANR